jgi:hypothetical protein
MSLVPRGPCIWRSSSMRERSYCVTLISHIGANWRAGQDWISARWHIPLGFLEVIGRSMWYVQSTGLLLSCILPMLLATRTLYLMLEPWLHCYKHCARGIQELYQTSGRRYCCRDLQSFWDYNGQYWLVFMDLIPSKVHCISFTIQESQNLMAGCLGRNNGNFLVWKWWMMQVINVVVTIKRFIFHFGAKAFLWWFPFAAIVSIVFTYVAVVCTQQALLLHTNTASTAFLSSFQNQSILSKTIALLLKAIKVTMVTSQMPGNNASSSNNNNPRRSYYH